VRRWLHGAVDILLWRSIEQVPDFLQRSPLRIYLKMGISLRGLNAAVPQHLLMV
jgi:hypothetical protein